MDRWYQSSSLLPYLTGVSDIQLDFSTVLKRAGMVETEGERGRGCTHALDSLSSRHESRIFCGGSFLRNVSLVIQRDHYPSFRSGPAPTNSSIDECWQRALDRRRSPETAVHHVFLNDHTDSDGNIRPFAPLSYCRERGCFFHPPCARCAKMLQLCTDDVLLGEFGLPQYRRSLRRYLYCPDCTPLHGTPWFTLVSAGEDVSVVKDRSGLLNSFGTVNDTVDPGLGFPCPGCSLSDTCYGPESRVAERVAVVAFYPFYLFIDGEAVLDGEFFLGLIGGGTARAIADKRSREIVAKDDIDFSAVPYSREDGYLFPVSDGRHFLEVLYLKLLFLKQVAGNGNSDSLLHYMSSRYVSPRELGVFRPVASSLPPFWNFTLTYQSVEQELEHLSPAAVKFRGSRMLFFGFFFFVVLLVNRNLQEEEILSQLKEILAQMEGSDSPPSAGHELFQARNIYWDPGSSDGAGEYGAVWSKIVDCGLSLLNGGLQGTSMEQWCAEAPLEKWTGEVASLLLSSLPLKDNQPDTAGNDEAILTILDTISAKWAGDGKTEASAGAAPVTGQSTGNTPAEGNRQSQPDGFDPDATVIIPADQCADNGTGGRKLTERKDFFNATLTQSFSNETLPGRESAGIDLSGTEMIGSEEKTLISPAPSIQPRRQPAAQPGPGVSTGEDDLLETVRITRKDEDFQEQTPVAAPEEKADDLLEETVVLNSNTGLSKRDPEYPAPAEGGSASRENPHLGRTKTPPEDEDDFLTETIVLKPKKGDT